MAKSMSFQAFIRRYPHDTDKIFKRGGQGVIFRAIDQQTGKVVAIKRASAHGFDPKYSVIREFELGKSLKHPNLAEYYAAFRVRTPMGSFDYGIMEFIDNGLNLDDYLTTFPTSVELHEVLIGILKGIDYLHSQGVIHRDLKPSNILIKYENGRPVPKIIDFGVSKDLDASETKSSAMVGTVEYMSPEQLGGFGIKSIVYHNTDLWALGVILYRIFIGESPFGAEDGGLTRAQIIQRIYSKPLPPQFDREIEKNYGYLIRRCLIKNPQERIQSVEEVLDILEGRAVPLAEVNKSKKETNKPGRKRPIFMTLLLTLLALGIIGGGGYMGTLLWQRQLVLNEITQAEALFFSTRYKDAFNILREQQTSEYFSPYGHYLLGKLYYEGYDSLEQNLDSAITHLYKATVNGYGEAMVHMAYLYENNDYVDADSLIALDWYDLAEEALQNLDNLKRATARASYGDLYYYGQGAHDIHYNKAIDAYRFAANEGYSYAQARLGYMYMYGQGASIEEEESNKWYKKAALQGEPDGLYGWGLSFERGFGVEQNDDTAYYWYEKAAARNNSNAEYKLGFFNYHGRGSRAVDFEQANYWFDRAAENGNVQAEFYLGLQYGKGLGVIKDERKSFSYYEKSANSGWAGSQSQLGFYYLSGIATNRNEKKALHWFRKAANQGHATGQYNLGYMFENGYGASTNLDSAVFWYDQSSRNGYPEARDALERLRESLQTITKLRR